MCRNRSCLQEAWGAVETQTETLTVILNMTALESPEVQMKAIQSDWQGWLTLGDKL